MLKGFLKYFTYGIKIGVASLLVVSTISSGVAMAEAIAEDGGGGGGGPISSPKTGGTAASNLQDKTKDKTGGTSTSPKTSGGTGTAGTSTKPTTSGGSSSDGSSSDGGSIASSGSGIRIQQSKTIQISPRVSAIAVYEGKENIQTWKSSDPSIVTIDKKRKC